MRLPTRTLTGLAACLLAALPAAQAPALAVPVSPAAPVQQNLPTLGDTEREDLPPALEKKIGEQIMREFRRDLSYLDDGPLLDYLSDFGALLLSAHPEARGEANYDYNFFAVRDASINAFALPGGNIGIHSGLLLAAQTESELASVMAHEIGHVSQRHIARMLGRQKQDAIIPLAALALAVLTAHKSIDGAQALALGGQGLAIQRQLSFSRDAEREADRVGLQILREANFDTSGMVAFFGRMQAANRLTSDSIPAFLLSHPLTTERIADIQGRIQDGGFRQRIDSLDFLLVRARARVLQDDSAQGMRDAAESFEAQVRLGTAQQVTAGKYGLAFLALKRGQLREARQLLDESIKASAGVPRAKLAPPQGNAFAALSIELHIAQRQFAEALKEAEKARHDFPLARGMARQYGETLIAAGRAEAAVSYLRDQMTMYRQEPQLHELLAKAYAAQGREALSHLALAEAHALGGALPAALDQLAIARRAKDATYYELAIVDSREREWQAKWKEEKKEREKSR